MPERSSYNYDEEDDECFIDDNDDSVLDEDWDDDED